MGKVKNRQIEEQEAIEIFGDYRKKFTIASDAETITEGNTVTLINSNCEFEFDNVTGCFENNLLHYFIVDLQFIGMDLSDYDPDKSNNGGKYAYGTFKIIKVHKKTY